MKNCKLCTIVALMMLPIIIISCVPKDPEMDANSEQIAQLQALYDEFAPIKVDANISHLNERERLLIAKLAEAGKIVDELF